MLSFSTLEFNMGEVVFGQQKQYHIIVTNNSSEVVELHNTGSSCSCTTGLTSPNPIDAYKEANFNITFDSNKAGRGLMVKSITVSWTIAGQSFTQVITFTVTTI